jgi:ribosomal protein L29
MASEKKGPKLVEIRERNDEELGSSLNRAREELFRMRLTHSTNQLENVSTIRHKKKEIARILTVMSGRKNGTEKTGAVKKGG